jgi:hypothetical protein
MDVRWDPVKAASNHRKHGVRFSDAEAVLQDPASVTVEDRAATGEQRFVSVGSDNVGRILVVVYAYRTDHIRLISARPASPKERRTYEEGV